MPIVINKELPAYRILTDEKIFVMDSERAFLQEIRPIEIAILNLMPTKETTETQFMRLLSNSPLQVNITLVKTSTYNATHTDKSHLDRFYKTFAEIKTRKFDGMIITGAPVEQIDFCEVDYWKELCEIMDWTKKHVTSTFHICWGAQAGLYHHFGIRKHLLESKLFGLFEHRVMNRRVPLVRGFDDIFLAPHSRHTAVSNEDIHACEELLVLAESEKAGIYLCMTDGGRQIFVMGHPEYDRVTLHDEYMRDKNKGLEIAMPENYYTGDDCTIRPNLQWRAHCNMLYSNWLNYYVYQATPYDLEKIG